jgi:hypothetical protein
LAQPAPATPAPTARDSGYAARHLGLRLGPAQRVEDAQPRQRRPIAETVDGAPRGKGLPPLVPRNSRFRTSLRYSGI